MHFILELNIIIKYENRLAFVFAYSFIHKPYFDAIPCQLVTHIVIRDPDMRIVAGMAGTPEEPLKEIQEPN